MMMKRKCIGCIASIYEIFAPLNKSRYASWKNETQPSAYSLGATDSGAVGRGNGGIQLSVMRGVLSKVYLSISL